MADISDSSAELLARVGNHVRRLRRSLALSRRELGRAAGVSERYLNELEAGRANVSLGVLSRIAQSLGVNAERLLGQDRGAGAINGDANALASLVASLTPQERARAHELLRRAGFDRPASKPGIALIGLRGAGKTALGERAAARLTLPFVRLSDVIQERSGMAIGELLEFMGVETYRRIEYEALEQVVAEGRTLILEVGGGLVLAPDTRDLLERHFHTVWIKARPEDHMRRVIEQGDLRPMAGSERAMDELRAILVEREPYYARAGDTVDTSGETLAACVDELVRITRHRLAI